MQQHERRRTRTSSSRRPRKSVEQLCQDARLVIDQVERSLHSGHCPFNESTIHAIEDGVHQLADAAEHGSSTAIRRSLARLRKTIQQALHTLTL